MVEVISHLDVDVQLLGDGHQIGAHLLQGADVARSQGDADAVHRRRLSLGLLEVLGHRSGGRSRSNSGSLEGEQAGEEKLKRLKRVSILRLEWGFCLFSRQILQKSTKIQ